jgi:hypothetical protein
MFAIVANTGNKGTSHPSEQHRSPGTPAGNEGARERGEEQMRVLRLAPAHCSSLRMTGEKLCDPTLAQEHERGEGGAPISRMRCKSNQMSAMKIAFSFLWQFCASRKVNSE